MSKYTRVKYFVSYCIRIVRLRITAMVRLSTDVERGWLWRSESALRTFCRDLAPGHRPLQQVRRFSHFSSVGSAHDQNENSPETSPLSGLRWTCSWDWCRSSEFRGVKREAVHFFQRGRLLSCRNLPTICDSLKPSRVIRLLTVVALC